MTSFWAVRDEFVKGFDSMSQNRSKALVYFSVTFNYIEPGLIKNERSERHWAERSRKITEYYILLSQQQPIFKLHSKFFEANMITEF